MTHKKIKRSIFAGRGHHQANKRILPQIRAGLKLLRTLKVHENHDHYLEYLTKYSKALTSRTHDAGLLPFTSGWGHLSPYNRKDYCVYVSIQQAVKEYWRFRSAEMEAPPIGLLTELQRWNTWVKAGAENLKVVGDVRTKFTLEVR